MHLGAPNTKADNVTVTFADYLKNVASSELYPTWPENALRANIYAQASFAINRVFTEFYRDQGYDFDITGISAYDQTFINGRDIFENISRIVDEIFDSYIRRENSIVPLYAQYCNGTTTVCDGLSQWGTVDLANQGLSPYEILQNYYGDDIVLVENVPVQGLMPSVPENALRLGSVSNDVRTIQRRLNRISVNYPLIPKIGLVDGFFGIETEDAVKEFQNIFNLAVDGVVGKETWYAIQRVYAGVRKLNSLLAEGVSYEEIEDILPNELRLGDTGEYVSSLQYYLNFLSEYNNTIPTVTINGIFDEATENSVIAFQNANGFEPTGVVTEAEGRRLFDLYIGILNSLPESQFYSAARPYPGFQLYNGVKGESVLLLQKYLNRINESNQIFPELTEDGIFGSETENAVSIFQSMEGLRVNGIVGEVTWNAIADMYDDIVAGSQVAESQYPGYVLDSSTT